MPELRCPEFARFDGDTIGCGSTNIEGPDEEGLYDCLNCGMWFTREAATQPTEVRPAERKET